MKHILYTFLSLILFSGSLFAQPVNDICSGATTLPQDGSCLAGTTAAADDHWIGGVGCQAGGGGNEVWYTFTATGTDANFVITNGTQTGNIEFIIVEASAPCTGLGFRGSSCGASPMNVTFQGFVPGTIYYVTVNSTGGTDGSFSICNTVTTPPPVPGQDCTNAAVLCDGSAFSQGVFSGTGAFEEISNNSCFGGDERQSKWYTFTVSQSGTLGFDILPNTATDDYDYAIWNTTGGCYTSATTMGTPIGCNWLGTRGPTGSNYLSTGTTTPNACTVVGAADCTAGNGPSGAGCQPCTYANYTTLSYTPLTVTAGETYSILIDNFSGSGGGFDFNFAGTAVIGPDATFDATVDVSCLTVSLDRLTFYTGANMTYFWNFGDGTTSTAAVPADHTYSTTGLYTITLEVTDANGCTDAFSETVDIGCILLSVKLENLAGEFVQKKYNRLTWNTAGETNNDHFVLERSNDGINWEDVNTINGNGNTQEARYYLYDDYNFKVGAINYNRLRQVQFSGINGHSQIVSIDNLKTLEGDKKIFKVVTLLGQITTVDAPGIKIVVYTDGTSVMMVNER
jgi:PKD repeat protein